MTDAGSRGRLRPTGRRRALALGAALWVLVGCTPPNLPPAISPSASPVDPTPPPRDDHTLVIGIDGPITGFNPYVAAQYSLAGGSVANLVLPSIFARGAWVTDANAVTSAEPTPTALVDRVEVTSVDPFTVTYSLNKNAAWTDGTPIAAEDFTFLWQQMVSQPGLVESGGYRLITDIRSADGGKTVIVEFATAYQDWRTLFSPLLPARTLKDQPGGFSGSLSDGIAVSGSYYKLTSFDPITGEIVLSRNDKYWGAEPGPATVTIRLGSPAELVDALNRGDVDAVYVKPDAATMAALTAQHASSRIHQIPLPATHQLLYNLDGPLTANLAIRRGVAESVDLAALARVWTGRQSDQSDLPQAMLTLPRSLSYQPFSADHSSASAESLLADAGFIKAGRYYERDGQLLSLILGYPIEDEHAAAAARALQLQLGQTGILIDLVGLSTADLTNPASSVVRADITLQTLPRGPSDGAVAIAAFGCLAQLEPDPLAPAALCPPSADLLTPSVDPQMRALLAGTDRPVMVNVLETYLWARLYVVPVAEPEAVIVVGDKLARVSIPGDTSTLLWNGPLADLPQWTFTG